MIIARNKRHSRRPAHTQDAKSLRVGTRSLDRCRLSHPGSEHVPAASNLHKLASGLADITLFQVILSKVCRWTLPPPVRCFAALSTADVEPTWTFELDETALGMEKEMSV